MHLHPLTLIYTPLPNSKGVHNMAGRYMCQNGLKMSGIVPLEHPKRSKIFFGKPQHLF